MALERGIQLQDALKGAFHEPRAVVAAAGNHRGEGIALIGASGAVGAELLSAALAHRGGPCADLQVATRAPLQMGLRGMSELRMPEGRGAPMPRVDAGIALIAFDRSRIGRQREEVFYEPAPDDLPRLARWLRDSGVHTLVIVHPHAPALLPIALRRGLATMDEHTVAGLGFERLLIVRPSQAAGRSQARGLHRFAGWWWSQLALMLPASDRPVRAATVAAFVFEALAQWQCGKGDAGRTRVAGPLELTQAARADGLAQAVGQWLAG